MKKDTKKKAFPNPYFKKKENNNNTFEKYEQNVLM